jgi:hypothetical protein
LQQFIGQLVIIQVVGESYISRDLNTLVCYQIYEDFSDKMGIAGRTEVDAIDQALRSLHGKQLVDVGFSLIGVEEGDIEQHSMLDLLDPIEIIAGQNDHDTLLDNER